MFESLKFRIFGGTDGFVVQFWKKKMRFGKVQNLGFFLILAQVWLVLKTELCFEVRPK